MEMRPAGDGKRLDEWYASINKIYVERNMDRTPAQIFSHLVEILGGLSLLASGKEKPKVVPEKFVPKALAWWMALCGKLGVASIEAMIWWKFPNVCAYCEESPHKQRQCKLAKRNPAKPDWAELARKGDSAEHRPSTLPQWQKMFDDIYPVTDTEEYAATFARFTEELGELAEAVRVFEVAPTYLLSEGADVFAWLMHLQNVLQEEAADSDRYITLERNLADAYPGRCLACGREICACPRIHPDTLGRIARESPERPNAFKAGGPLSSSTVAAALREREQALRVGTERVVPDARMIDQIHELVTLLMEETLAKDALMTTRHAALLAQVTEIRLQTEDNTIDQETLARLEELLTSIDSPYEWRQVAINFLAGLASSAWASALLEILRHAG